MSRWMNNSQVLVGFGICASVSMETNSPFKSWPYCLTIRSWFIFCTCKQPVYTSIMIENVYLCQMCHRLALILSRRKFRKRIFQLVPHPRYDDGGHRSQGQSRLSWFWFFFLACLGFQCKHQLIHQAFTFFLWWCNNTFGSWIYDKFRIAKAGGCRPFFFEYLNLFIWVLQCRSMNILMSLNTVKHYRLEVTSQTK